MEKLRSIARKVSNWGRWGEDDERGTLNLVTPDVLRRAAAAVRDGKVFSLGLPLGAQGPQIGQGGRINPLHLMTVIDGRVGDDPEGFRFADDLVVMPLQCATQWDALSHAYYGGKLYNGYPSSSITTGGAARLGIEKFGAAVVSRGVLLDVARLRGVDRLAPGTVIRPEDLEAAEKTQGVRVESGDVLLVRTGHMRVFTVDGDRVGYMRQSPGLGIDCAEWLHERGVAAVASDTLAVEVIPFEDPACPLPLHLLCLREMGMPLGEMFDLEELARDCATDGRYECFFSAPALKVVGGVGSPLNPVALK
ncbi:MAG: cyclase [Candidatus Binatia bacterium]|nr:MAG: cyclase [Candidatus Binatia bacterium]